jgi:hypothetical protein
MGTIVLLWILAGILSGVIAKSKNRSFVLWFIYGFFLSIIAIPHALLLQAPVYVRPYVHPGGPRPLSRPVVTVQKQCPHCAQWIDQQAAVCRFCGKRAHPPGESRNRS